MSARSEILGMSFDSAASPSITVHGSIVDNNGASGWGFGWYPNDDTAGVVIKNPKTSRESVMTSVLKTWDRFCSSTFVCHLRGAAKRASQQDTLPFLVRYAGRNWIFSHSGILSRHITTELQLGDNPEFEPVGKTDSEHAFCWILTQLRHQKARTLADAGWNTIHELFDILNKYGTASFFLSDGQTLIAYRDEGESNQNKPGAASELYFCRRKPPFKETLLSGSAASIDFDNPLDQNKTMLLISTEQLEPESWQRFKPGQMLAARLGKIVWNSHAEIEILTETLLEIEDTNKSTAENSQAFTVDSSQKKQTTHCDAAPSLLDDRDSPPSISSCIISNFISAQRLSGDEGPPILALSSTDAPMPDSEPKAEKQDEDQPRSDIDCSALALVTASLTTYAERVNPEKTPGSQETLVVELVDTVAASPVEKARTLSVIHQTYYEYKDAVEYSTHRLHVQPVHDLKQELLLCKVEVSPAAETREFEDVFGNHCIDLSINESYKQLLIRVESKVRVHPQPHLKSSTERMTIPLVWMPWQRQMMLPYLLPPELPESELRALTDYAMGFVKREDYDLLEALLEMNRTIFTDFEYVTGSTTLSTTPFEVLINRKGVCQDFANLFICMARLLGLPARYRVGYINTGADYENKVQSEASHAWAELYLPRFGWYGFDPTNGCLVGNDHIRVAAGRNYRDASPTSGTIYRGGGGERLSVMVQVKVDDGIQV